MLNCRYISSLSRQTNKIIKNHTNLNQPTSQSNRSIAFRSIGIDTQVRILNNSVQILASFNINNKIHDYQISRIE